jgi:phosphatidylinositol alpha-1,6-mannosyltransferase
MAAGTPAVAARVGGIPEFAADGENALLVAPDDDAALAAALRRLANDPVLRDRLAAGGRARADELSWARIAPRYVSIYRRVAHA